MLIAKLADAELPQASVAVNVKLKAPFATGVPVMERDKSELVTMFKPVGSAPPDTRNAGEGENGVANNRPNWSTTVDTLVQLRPSEAGVRDSESGSRMRVDQG